MQCKYLGRILTICIGNENETNSAKHIQMFDTGLDNIDILHKNCDRCEYRDLLGFCDELRMPIIIEQIGLLQR